MKVAVTGVAGLIGSWLAKDLLDRGHRIVGVDNLSGGYIDNVPPVSDKMSFFPIDIVNDRRGLCDAFEGCDVVVHCAATAYEGLSVFSPGIITTNIVGGTANVASACAQAKVKRLINTSSMARYGDAVVVDGMFREFHHPSPVDPYGAAKLFAEQQADMIGKLHGFEVAHAVPHSVNGPGQKYDDPFRNVVSIMANLMLRGRQPYIYGDGEQKRGFCDVRDVVPIYRALLDCDLDRHGDVYNLGPDDEDDYVSINELARRVASFVGFHPLQPIHVEARPNEVKLANCSADRIRSKFGFSKTVSLERSIKDIVRHIRSRGTVPFSYRHIEVEITESREKKCLSTWKNRLL